MGATNISTIENFSTRLRAPGYLILTIAAVTPLFDLTANLLPLHFPDPAWRFGVLGLLGGFAMVIIVQLFFLFALAAMSNDRRVLIAIGVIAALAAVLMLASSVSFSLDGLQTRARVNPQLLKRFDYAIVQGLSKLLLSLISSAALSRACFKTARGMGAVRVKAVPAPVIVARSAAGRPGGISDIQGR
jgi:hypothetical protein